MLMPWISPAWTACPFTLSTVPLSLTWLRKLASIPARWSQYPLPLLLIDTLSVPPVSDHATAGTSRRSSSLSESRARSGPVDFLAPFMPVTPIEVFPKDADGSAERDARGRKHRVVSRRPGDHR